MPDPAYRLRSFGYTLVIIDGHPQENLTDLPGVENAFVGDELFKGNGKSGTNLLWTTRELGWLNSAISLLYLLNTSEQNLWVLGSGFLGIQTALVSAYLH
jgi:hypothetical protein